MTMHERYDIFVSYSHADKEFVHGWLLSRLEAAGLRVCIDSRDFEFGTPSLTNMERAIERSRHTMAVLTRSWIESQWTDFEALLVGSADPAGRRKRLLPLLVESCDVPPRIGMLTYADLREPSERERELKRLLDQIRDRAQSPEDFGVSSESRKHEERLEASTRLALKYLLAMQYPWGEWSDRRTTIESSIAERPALRGPEGPKPNLARTLFALEAFERFLPKIGDHEQRLALEWISKGVSRGWYREWSARQTMDSEDALPALYLRKDIRHTAQATATQLKWIRNPEILPALVQTISRTQLKSGLWPESPGYEEPRVLASIYALECLGAALSTPLPGPIEAMLGSSLSSQAWAAFRLGLAALHREVDRGHGLLGESAGGATPYLTGIGLFRLAPLTPKHADVSALCTKMLQALDGAMTSDGWQDLALRSSLRDATRKRTTLRVAAGLARCTRARLSVPSSIWDRTGELVAAILSSAEPLELDSPDYACGVIALVEGAPDLSDRIDAEPLIKEAAVLRKSLAARWVGTFRDHLSRLREGRALGLPGYERLSRTIERELELLNEVSLS